MPATYSRNPGTPTESFKLVDIDSVLNELPDNTSGLINPHDLRDGIYTTWENIVIKPTISNGIEYIGIDRNNLYEKIFLGKKQISGSNILTSNLLNSDVDLFIYNNKTDSDLTSQNTKVGFLLGKYTGISEASRQTLCHPELISKCCKDKTYYTVNSTTFRYEGDIFDYYPYNKNIQVLSRKVSKLTYLTNRKIIY
jgi:hypothetical protein